ncbi:MAG TPA: tetratricopeptide repeat protein, partial [Chloroflexota bacterium]|nr:tetratricopeptide repeat protein [Chloroflexota bacterium]
MKERTAKDYTIWLAALCLALLTLVTYWQTFGHDYVAYDDEQYVTMNPYVQQGLTRDSIRWAFTSYHASNWHPLTWMSHMLDQRLFGMSPVGPHAVNLLLHIANTILLLFVLRRMTKSLWKSAFVAALFALHPMHVESVAWVAERKDVLSTLFLLLTVWAYVKYTERPSTSRYLPVMLLFGLGLLSKPSLVTLPFALLLLDYWPLRRLQTADKRQQKGLVGLIAEKIPLIVMAVASSAATYWAQNKGGAMIVGDDRLSLPIRMDNAIVSYANYIGRMFWPHDMAIFYPHPASHIPVWQVAAGLVLLAGITVLALKLGRRHPSLPVGWLWYLGILVPMIGLVQVGKAAMADRYTYVSYIGLFIMIAWGIPECMGVREHGSMGGENSHTPTRPHSHTALSAVAGLVIAALCVCTWFQLRYWQNAMTLFSHALAVTSGNDGAHIQVGNYLFKEGKTVEAIKHYQAALKINPYTDRAHTNLGNAYARLGQTDLAIREYQAALELRQNPVAYYNLGNLYSRQGKLEEAVGFYKKALDIQPDYVEARTNLSRTLVKLGRTDEAAEQASELAKLMPNSAQSHYQLALVLMQAKNLDGAIAEYRAAIRLKSDFAPAHYNLGTVLAQKGQLDEAFQEFSEAVRIKPDYADAYFNIGVVYDSRNDMALAMKEYRLAIKVKPDHAEAHTNLAID